MKTLTLSIKQTEFEEIASGKKRIVTRDIKPSNSHKYIGFEDLISHTKYTDWKAIPNGTQDIYIQPIKYDYIIIKPSKSADGKECPKLCFKVNDTEVLCLMDENEDQIYKVEKGQEYPAMCIDYFLGEILNVDE
ncbi:MAG TPA: hypothetical protein P5023_01125 [Bacteroidales bacterium]|jgi:hypothetical protein|nr:hypothetical protein [Bacteroidales bacterium]HRR49925.1 hypothetical protein [Bacteroidales bacterium]HRT33026.1 hypothetical protein [Bacteroidales bacterium]